MANYFNNIDSIELKHSLSEADSVPDLYRAELNSSNNQVFNRQFSVFYNAVNKEGVSSSHFINQISGVLKSRGLSTHVQLSDLMWPAGFDENNNTLTVHPDFFKIGQSNQDCRLFCATEVFDRVIYAQLHHEFESGSAAGNVSNTGGDELLALVQIKAAKQEAILKQQLGTESGRADSYEEIIDPTSAWNIASPRYGFEGKCTQAFEQALNAYFIK
jgi:hypothetical protein